jgi:deazaflavin-dependent oxidoreductase (nitroreductase family)
MAKRPHPDLPFVYLTTVGRRTGLPREIEIWFVAIQTRLYIFAEHHERANWVRNIRANPRVRVRLGTEERDATARVLDRKADAELWNQAQSLARAKYGWGDGQPVEIMPDQSFW